MWGFLACLLGAGNDKQDGVALLVVDEFVEFGGIDDAQRHNQIGSGEFLDGEIQGLSIFRLDSEGAAIDGVVGHVADGFAFVGVSGGRFSVGEG